MQETKRKLKRQPLRAAAFVSALILIPATMAAGIIFFDGRKYYITSLLLILYIMLPFFLSFERRKPQPKELAAAAVMCAVAAGGRIAFFWLPQFKPTAALIIMAGISFGPQSGFLLGAVTAFVSNFYFGQGPWTPWQMLALGLTGLAAGLIFKKSYLPDNPLLLSLFGAAAAIIIYGGIVNLGSLLISTGTVTVRSLAASYLAGLPMDAVHAASTFIFLFFAAGPILKILKRIKAKYGIYV